MIEGILFFFFFKKSCFGSIVESVLKWETGFSEIPEGLPYDPA